MALDKINGRPLNEVLQDKVLGPLGLTNTTDPGSPVIAEPVLHAWDSEQRSVYNIPSSLPVLRGLDLLGHVVEPLQGRHPDDEHLRHGQDGDRRRERHVALA